MKTPSKAVRLTTAELEAVRAEPIYEPGRAYLWVLTYGWATAWSAGGGWWRTASRGRWRCCAGRGRRCRARSTPPGGRAVPKGRCVMGGLDDLRARLLRETGDPTLDVVLGYGAALWLARWVTRPGYQLRRRDRIGALRLTADGSDLATGPLRKALPEATRRAVAKAVREWREAGKEGE